MSKSGSIQFAEAADFGATAAERVQGGNVGILFVDASDDTLKLINEAGEVVIAKVGGANVVFSA